MQFYYSQSGQNSAPTVRCGSVCRLRHVPLVSRRFSEACRDPSLWSELHVLQSAFRTEARWRSFLRWLSVRARGLQKLVVGRNQTVRAFHSFSRISEPSMPVPIPETGSHCSYLCLCAALSGATPVLAVATRLGAVGFREMGQNGLIQCYPLYQLNCLRDGAMPLEGLSGLTVLGSLANDSVCS